MSVFMRRSIGLTAIAAFLLLQLAQRWLLPIIDEPGQRLPGDHCRPPMHAGIVAVHIDLDTSAQQHDVIETRVGACHRRTSTRRTLHFTRRRSNSGLETCTNPGQQWGSQREEIQYNSSTMNLYSAEAL